MCIRDRIIAPVSLLENWEEETQKFFKPDCLPILTLYGSSIKALRVPRASIDAQLTQEGLVKFLRPGWRQGARLVLTTYETLRDFEFSFAEEDWSIMVCDEAQKIKNPNTLMTVSYTHLDVYKRQDQTAGPASGCGKPSRSVCGEPLCRPWRGCRPRY